MLIIAISKAWSASPNRIRTIRLCAAPSRCPRAWSARGLRGSACAARARRRGGRRRRRRERAVAVELLDRAQVGAAGEEVGRERVPEPMRVGDDPPQRARVEPAAAGGEEECVVRFLRKRWPGLAQVAAEPERCLLAEWDDPVLAALAAANVHELLLEIDVGEVEPHRLGTPQPR